MTHEKCVARAHKVDSLPLYQHAIEEQRELL